MFPSGFMTLYICTLTGAIFIDNCPVGLKNGIPEASNRFLQK